MYVKSTSTVCTYVRKVRYFARELHFLAFALSLAACFLLCGCLKTPPVSPHGQSIPADTQLPNHDEYYDQPMRWTSISWDGVPDSLLERYEKADYAAIAEVQIGRYQRCYGGMSIFTATVNKVYDVVDKENAPLEGDVIMLMQSTSPKSAVEGHPLYSEGTTYIFLLRYADEKYYQAWDDNDETCALRNDYPELYLSSNLGVDVLRIIEYNDMEYVYVSGFNNEKLTPEEHFLVGFDLEMVDDVTTEAVIEHEFGEGRCGEFDVLYLYEDFANKMNELFKNER